MPFSHAPISSMASLSANPLGSLQQQHQQHKYEQHQQAQYHHHHHQRGDDMTSSTYQCHMSRLNIPSPSIQSLHQAPHSSLTTLHNSHSYSSTSSSPHNPLDTVPSVHPSSTSTPPPSSSLAPPSSIYSYDPISLGGYGSRLSPCGTSENYQLNGSSYSNGNGTSGNKLFFKQLK